ncbi:class I SAM-dependent methyltransferase [Neolewinella aurantiaca]|uniref:class I SAM-dependent methyltransferase n=1 Tax=Neolewinella aurantiaca TaxID=2602767 RepID=UPI001FEBFBCF|nr:class I SAM-dependent methyltransferase [Neolewinella aurantiaca]
MRFNWHFYVLAVVGVALGLLVARWLGGYWYVTGICVAIGVLATTLISLLVSWYVYDKSELYRFEWLPNISAGAKIVNIHAGFDETSVLLADKYPTAELTVLDFYDPELHTEVSIKRARKMYPSYPGTIRITTDDLLLEDDSVDVVFLLMAAHEIRDAEERGHFFRRIHRGLKPGGRVVLTEHLRDGPNTLAYSFGVFHFLPYEEWHLTFSLAGFEEISEEKITPFLTTFTLIKDVDSP